MIISLSLFKHSRQVKKERRYIFQFDFVTKQIKKKEYSTPKRSAVHCSLYVYTDLSRHVGIFRFSEAKAEKVLSSVRS